MKRRQQAEIKKSAGQDMIILLEHWKEKKRRQQRYRYCLGGVFCLCCLLLIWYGYLILDRKVPSVIWIKAGTEQSIHLRVPMTGDVSVVSTDARAEYGDESDSSAALIRRRQSEQEKNEQQDEQKGKEAITLNLAEPITLKADQLKDYQMDVKLFGLIPFKQVDIKVIEERELIPMGIPIGIYLETPGVMVADVGSFQGIDGTDCFPAQKLLQPGDYILQLNGTVVEGKEQFIQEIMKSEGKEVHLTVEREERLSNVTITPQQNQNGEYKIGVWVKDNAQGVGTMTYIDSDGRFGALGHGVNDIDTSALMELEEGSLYRTSIAAIKKGRDGVPGEMTGRISYTKEYILGHITENNENGIFGVCNEKISPWIQEEALPIGLRQEITTGPAQICCTVADTPEYFDIEILAIHPDRSNINRRIELKVTDPKLLEVTGGIIQGMSGSPIIQDGKIVGAVTHVLVNDPTTGYGIFIDNMLDAAS